MATNQSAAFSPDREELERDQQVEALVAQLKEAGNADAAKLVKRLHSSLDHTRYWYGTRHERLWHWAHEELNEQQRNRYFSIVANGTADMTEPPTYAQQFNQMRWRMEAAEKERDQLRAKLAEMSQLVESNGSVATKACDQWEALEKQRDELLVALVYAYDNRDTRHEYDSKYDSNCCGVHFGKPCDCHVDAVEKTLAAAIAHAKGGVV